MPDLQRFTGLIEYVLGSRSGRDSRVNRGWETPLGDNAWLVG